MKKWLLGFWVLICCVSCNSSQNIDNQKDSKLFDLTKYKKYLDTNKNFEPYGRIHQDSSFSILYHHNMDSLPKLQAIEILEAIFQDSSNYYNEPPSSGSYSFYLNSLVFETPDYCGITIDKDTDNGWTTNIKTYFLAYRKGKLIGINEIAGTKGSGWGAIMIDPYKMKSKLINDNVFLVETINLTNEDDSDLLGGFTHIDTLSKLVTFGLNGKLETRTLYEATKPFDKNYHELKSINPLTGHKVTQRLFFYKDK